MRSELSKDMIQGRGGDVLVKMLDKTQPSAALRTCCVFLPEGSVEFGKHDELEDGTCWCSKMFAEGGLEYVVGGKYCKEEDIDKEKNRTTFGCEWYKVWKHQVAEAHAKHSQFYAVVPDSGEPGNSQTGEMKYLEYMKIDYKKIKLTDFLNRLEDFMCGKDQYKVTSVEEFESKVVHSCCSLMCG